MGKSTGSLFDLAQTVFQRRDNVSPLQLHDDCFISEWQFAQNVSSRQRSSGWINLIGANATPVSKSYVCAGCHPYGVGNQVANGGFFSTDGCATAVKLRGGRPDFKVEFHGKFIEINLGRCCQFRIRFDVCRVR